MYLSSGSDVVIASRLEATGMPGHIHISDRTLDLMAGHPYVVLPGTEQAREDPYLLKNDVTTYLIPVKEDYDDKFSMQSVSIQSCQSIGQMQIEEELHNEFQKMPVGPPRYVCIRFELCFKLYVFTFSHSIKRIISDLFSWKTKSIVASVPLSFASLHFDDPVLEYNYIRQHDYLLRFSMLLSWGVGLTLVLIELDYNSRSETLFWVPYEMMFVLTVLLFITWYKKLCYWRYSQRDGETNEWFSPISCWIFYISEKIQKNLTVRVGIYMYIIVSYILLVSIVLVSRECGQYI